MAMRATYTIECACGNEEKVKREQKPNERLPEFVLPAGWVETKDGQICPTCAQAQA